MAGIFNNLLHKESAMNRPLRINLAGFKCHGLYVWEQPALHTHYVTLASPNFPFKALFCLLFPGSVSHSDD